jgi:polyphosphate kinase 2
VTASNNVKLSEGEALKNVNCKGSDKKIQVWIPKSVIEYEEDKLKLQIELLKLQTHVKKTGQRIVMLFEGRDAAGKGGTIKRIREHLNPRGARVVALEKPSDRERTQWYFQRYTDHLPSAGEIVIFDRSWYNRSMVEPVMGFCTDEQHKRFLKYAPVFERILTKEGIILFKLYFSVSKKMQLKRFEKRTKDPLKQYKLSPVDMQAQELWGEYTMRKFQMLLETNTSLSPWTIIRSDDKKKARINCMKHILNRLDYEGKIEDSELEEDLKIVISGIDEIKLMEGNLSKPHKLPG